ncbi:MAG: hypothetical protein CM1200mP2_13670 [Planctomycetaceae bacterium]|nr:MAG: hypothetical protein CM1200mP2_13670 [Planctomycetaceae bacterium]
MHVSARGLIFDATVAAENEAVAYVTSLVPLDSGAFLCGWQSGPGKHTATNTIGLARSTDGAHTWHRLPVKLETSFEGTPGSFLAAEMVESEPGRLLLFTTWIDRRIPDRPLFNPETEGILPTRILTCSSADDGNTWSHWSELNTAELTGCAVTGPILRWTDGTIACSFESFKEFDDPTPVEPAAWLMVSRDGGRSFGEPWQVARHPQQTKYYWDQRLCPTQNPGEFVGMFWTHNRPEQRDTNVHLLRASIHDEERAAAEPFETSIPGQIAACALTRDGRILSCVVDRGRPGTITLWQSADDGQTWPEDERLVVHVHDEQAAISQGREEIDYAEFWEDMGKWSFGHPAIRPLKNGWLLAWYAGTPDRMSIHWAHVAEDV